ncbi:MAG: clostripain-related cysteine peptidase [Bacteroidales bacterium]|nr:clostripain-related cysteine peptidase [Bacteroidales bacterium]
MKNFFRIVICGAAIVAATACSSKGSPTPPPGPVQTTVLVYMAADNSLGVQLEDSTDIREMQAAARAGELNGGRLLIYHKGYRTSASLSEIKADGKIVRLHEYGDDGLTSVHSARMARVLADARAAAPATHFGVVLWSHGDGWLQNGLEEDEQAKKGKSASMPAGAGGVSTLHKPEVAGFGSEGGRKMKVSTLATVLGNSGPIDFVYFDCCYMANVEVAYEMRNVTPVIAGSAIELPAEGMPYDKTLHYFFADGEPDIVNAARTTFSHFDTMTGEDRTCAMTVINTAGLPELASVTRKVYEIAAAPVPGNYRPQRYQVSSQCMFYDLADYVTALAADANAPSLAGEWRTAFDGCITYAAATPFLWNRVALDRHNGLSTMILASAADIKAKKYDTLQWYADVASAIKF